MRGLAVVQVQVVGCGVVGFEHSKVLDSEVRVVYVNQTAADYFGLPKHEIVGKSFKEIEPDEETARRFIELGQQIMATGEPCVSDTAPYPEPDGTLSYCGNQGSIHRLGAIVQGKTACNGWTFWHFEADGKLKPIDLLREEAKRQLGLGTPAIIAAE